jgi:hypothetical protein
MAKTGTGTSLCNSSWVDPTTIAAWIENGKVEIGETNCCKFATRELFFIRSDFAPRHRAGGATHCQIKAFSSSKMTMHFSSFESKQMIPYPSFGGEWSLVGDFAAFFYARAEVNRPMRSLTVRFIERQCLRFSVWSKTCRCTVLTIASVI